jgi:hypothetical protein
MKLHIHCARWSFNGHRAQSINASKGWGSGGRAR